MKESDKNNIYRISIIPILTGNCSLCLFSIIVNIIEICIILSLKFLQSILYRLLFLISISEIINCIFHIVQSFLIIFNFNNIFLYFLNSLIIFFTDNFSIILLACLCNSMNALILKQNRKLASNQSYKLFSIIFAIALTFFYLLFFIINKDKYFYAELISWKFLYNEKYEQNSILSLNFFFYFITIFLYFLIISYSFYLIIKIQLFINEKSQEELKSKNWIKLKEFKFKMIKYPLFGALWIFPLIIYSLIEIIQKNEKNIEKSETIYFLRIKYCLFFIFNFISSIRGVLFFKLFISNEKIKKYIQFKIKNILFLENVLKNELSEIINNSSNNNTEIKTNTNKISENEYNFGLFQEGLIDDRDFERDKCDDGTSENDDESISANRPNIKSSINTMPDNNNINQSLSSLSENKKDNISIKNEKNNNPLKISELSE